MAGAAVVGNIRLLNQKEFDLALRNMRDIQVPERIEKFTRKTATFVLKRVIKRTPKGDPSLWSSASLPPPAGYQPGRARGGWQVGVNRSTENDINRIDPEGDAALAAGLLVISTIKAFDRVIIYNNVPYILELEHGSSTQAPSGMVRLTVIEANNLRN